MEYGHSADGHFRFSQLQANMPACVGVRLGSLAGNGLSGKFHAWMGRSGARYICSVFSSEDIVGMDVARSYSGAVVLAVRCGLSGEKTLIGGGETGELPELFWNGQAASRLGAQGADEFHIHLIAETLEARQVALRDLLCVAIH